MSTDLLLKNGDLQIANNGDFDIVYDTQKLVQDILKALYTPVGNDPFNPSYGVTLTSQAIGRADDLSVLAIQMRSDIERVIKFIHNNQQTQLFAGQTLTKGEVVLGLADLQVERDTVDPRLINVSLIIKAQDYSNLQINFNVQTFLNDAFNPDALRSLP
jgi:hypothetical protein